jgi:hypothetical protein
LRQTVVQITLLALLANIMITNGTAVVTHDGSSNLILYIDGVQVASKSISGASPDSSGTQPVREGANSRTTPPSGNFFTGEVDEVRVSE